MDDSSSQRPRAMQWLLGCFIVVQLVFLVGSNVLGMVPHGGPEEGELSDSRHRPEGSGCSGPLQSGIDSAADAAECWAHLTGQVQAWWLFAPSFPSQATFPVVELRWDDVATPGQASAPGVASQPMRLFSFEEPENPDYYFRLPGSGDRLFHYEVRMGLLMTVWDPKTVAEYPEVWQEAVRTRVSRQWKSMRAYLRWRVQTFQREHPELPAPHQAILSLRIYQTPGTGEDPLVHAKPVEQPLARWLLAENSSGEYLPVEACNPVSGRFERLPSKP